MADHPGIIAFEWYEAVRRRPSMYLGGLELLGALSIVRQLLDCGAGTTSARIAFDRTSVDISLACTPPSLAARHRSGVPFLLEACTRIAIQPDNPPTLAMCEIFQGDPTSPGFRRVPGTVSTLALANALSKRFSVSSISRAQSTTLAFAGGRPIGIPIESRPRAAIPGMRIRLTPDEGVLGSFVFGLSPLAEVARDVSLVREVPVTLVDRSERTAFCFADGAVTLASAGRASVSRKRRRPPAG